MKKVYVVDTNVLLEDEFAIETLRNGLENKVYIPYSVINELDGLKKDIKKRDLVFKAIEQITKNYEHIEVCRDKTDQQHNTGDESILNDLLTVISENPILVSNDKIFRIKAKARGIESEEYFTSNPFKSESEEYTGIIKGGEALIESNCAYENCFTFLEGKPAFYKNGKLKPLTYLNDPWKIKPRNDYQNMALELLLDNDISVVSLQSRSGYGKTYLALASALYLMLEKKLFDKIYIVKSPVEIGPQMGFLPGDAMEKLEPYFRPICDLIHKLHKTRECKRVFIDEQKKEFDKNYIEMLPLAFVRGMNIENSIVIIDEMQNLSRVEARAILTRMGENTRVFCIGDTNQVDNQHLNEFNNGLNWLVKLCKGQKEYGHLVLKGEKSRGPVTDLILKVNL